MTPLSLPIRRLAAALTLTLTTPLLAQDPPPPPGGFPVTTLLSQTLTFSDGATSLVDIYYPSAPAPLSGWPGVMALHGSGGNRQIPDVQRAGNHLAAAGFTVYAYDRRSFSAGVPAERVLLDDAETHVLVQSIVPGLIDPQRLAMTGFSGGGKASLMGAAWSGKPLPLTGLVTHYPTLLAVAPEIASIDAREISMPSPVLAGDHMSNFADPAVQAALQAEDYALLDTLIQEPLNIATLAELYNSTVPVLKMVAAQDFKIVNNPSLDRFPGLPMQKRLSISTGGHSTVKNDHERALQQDMRRRWFDRYLKFIPNGVELEPEVELAMQPPSNAVHADVTSIWEHRNFAQWPPAMPNARFFLRGGSQLDAAPPLANETGPVLQHRPTGTFVDYRNNGYGLAPFAQFANIPKVETSFDSAPLPDDGELIGRVRVHLQVNDSTGVFQLSALLTHVAPNGTETWVSMGTAGERSQAGQHVMQIELDDVGHVIPQGHSLRLRILNLADHNAPGTGHRIRVVPYFTATDTQVRMEPGAASYVDLPMRSYSSNLSPRLATGSAVAGIAHMMMLRGGNLRAGAPYLTLCGVSGEAPGFIEPGGLRVPVNVDGLTISSLTFPNSLLFPMSAGSLDADGGATPGFALPAPVATLLAGFRVTFASAVFAPGGAFVESVTNATTLEILP